MFTKKELPLSYGYSHKRKKMILNFFYICIIPASRRKRLPICETKGESTMKICHLLDKQMIMEICHKLNEPYFRERDFKNSRSMGQIYYKLCEMIKHLSCIRSNDKDLPHSGHTCD